ncbi:copper resistance CopC/CopD family protein [Streptomyces sp. NBC_01803]|uniref:copper resistance CopC/CopD family protein n=1 Tax=Streptomyces sp. NBC_01803 TaxID=2975946 RepID=UPI002DDA2CC5|nr:copper resistance protein CopC [Streptomyces sp. NBC_01803]WSA45359.1 copper resistance protein CopC [Streptomyces sp. NBC_01803]
MTTTTPAAVRSPAAPLLIVVAALATLLLGATPAAAHASLTGSTPADGEVVATAPAQVTLTFSEQVALSDDSIRVLDPRAERADTGDVTDEGDDTHAVALRPGLEDGTYTVAWQAVSADSHPIAGAFTFSIGAPSATTVELPDQAVGEGGVGLLYDIARYAAYAGFLLLAGACAFVLLCRREAAAAPAVQRVTLTGWTTLTAATIALLLLRTPYTTTGRLADALDLGGLRDVIDTKTGTALVTRLLLLAAAGLLIALLHGGYARLVTAAEDDRDEDHDVRVRDLTFGLALGGVILATGLAATWAMAEHASTGRQTALAIPADVLHLLAVATWLGGLATLLTLLRAGPAVPRAAVRRFSRLALTSVTVLTVTGLYQAWRQIGWSWSGLTDTQYGRLLLLKVGIVGALLCVAWNSRRWTARLGDVLVPEPDTAPSPSAAAGADAGADPARAQQLARQRAAIRRADRRKARDADPHRAALRRSVLAEAAIAAVLLAVATWLSGTTPARTASDTGTEAGAETGDHMTDEPVSVDIPYDTGGDGGQGTARLDLSPAHTGENTLQIHLSDPEGRPATAAEVRVALTLPDEDLGPLRYDPVQSDAAQWTVTGLQLPRPGDWRLALTIRTSDIDQVTETATLPIE